MPDTEYPSHPSLKDRPVIISGGASGIGAELVRAFAGQGARVGFVDINSGEGDAFAAQIQARGETAHFIGCDVTDIEAYRGAITAFAERHGPARVLINNAGSDARHDWQNVTPDYWDRRMAVNLKHAFFATQAVAPAMGEAGGGSIINMGSISWMVGVGEMPAYTTAKAALHGLSRTLAADMGELHIRVNTIAPGAIITPQQLENRLDPEDLERIERGQFLPGHLTPRDVAAMALFLASDASAMITGQQFLVDGGWAHG